ncbi:MAG: ornithine cyclodeaminase family protein [Nocardiopsaceae bacterium]|nr:ornithine cyclodeaminase family protein [Nocardiopsaceae bacterium]
MELLVLSSGAVRSVLSYPRCAEAMRDALVARARGEVFQPLRSILKPEGASGMMGLMPSYQPGNGYGLKAINVTPGNPAIGLDTHQGIVLVSDEQTGQPLAILNASAVTEIRTAAVSAVATEQLAAAGADVLAIVGTGVQARSHLMAIAAISPLAEVRIAGSAPAKAAKFAADVAPAALAEVGAADVAVSACDSVRAAVDGAQIVVTATSSATPVLEQAWLAPGTHINAVGACLPHTRELDTATVAAAGLFADSRESVLAESGDYLLAAADGAIGPDHIRAELGELLARTAPDHGRRSTTEITIFESLGLAIEDLAAAMAAYQVARESGAGNWIEFD